jgi:non-heme chloroperoxidase
MSHSHKPMMASMSERENQEIEAANASGNTPVVFIHGL